MSGDTSRVPAPLDALLPLATAAADGGLYDRVRELYETAAARGIPAADVPAWERLLREAGAFDLLPKEAGTESAPQRGSDEAQAEEEDPFEFEPGERDASKDPAAQPTVATFLRLFGGRRDVYARQWYDARADRGGYHPVREPLTPDLVLQHLEGRITLGQYVLHPDATVSFAALDLDPTPEAWEQLRLGREGEGGLALAPLTDYARRLTETAERMGLVAIPEDTGGFGLHIWMVFDPRIPAARARSLLRELLWRTGAQPPAVAVELFPKQDALSGKGLGNLIKLPLGIHQATLRRSRFLDAGLRPLDDAEGIGRVRPCPPAAIEAVLATRIVPLRPGGALAPPWDESAAADDEEDAPCHPAPPGAAGLLRQSDDRSPRALADALAAIPAGQEANTAADRVLAGCAVLRELSRRAFEDHALGADAARALLYTVGLVGRGNERIETLFKQAGLGRRELERVHRGRQPPMGCRKLHELFPDLATGCACPPAGDYAYASPVLFALLPPVRCASSRRSVERRTHVDVTPPAPRSPSVEDRLARIEAALSRLLERDEDT